MINELDIKNFGKFREKKFDFGEITVFFGKNESGKTTIFDAIFIALSDVKKNTGVGKLLEFRYGDVKKDDVMVNSSYNNKIPYHIFLNTLAIRSGEVHFDFSEREIIDSLMKNLLSIDVNFEELKKRFAEKASSDRRMQINREKEELADEIENIDREIANLKSEIDEYENLELRLNEETKLLKDKENKLKESEQNYLKLNEELEGQSLAKEIKDLDERHKEVDKLLRLKRDLSQMEVVDESDVKKVNALTEKIDNLRKEIDSLYLKNNEKKVHLSGIEKEIEELDKKISSIPNVNKLKIEMKKLGVFKLTSNVFFFLLAILFLIKDLLPGYLVLPLVVGFLLSFLMLRLFCFIKQLMFRKNYGIAGQKEIQQLENEKNICSKELIRKRAEREEGIFTISKTEKEISILEDEIKKLENELKLFLTSKGVKSYEELIDKKARREMLMNNMSELSKKVKERMRQMNESEIESYERRLRIRIGNLEEKGVSVSDYNERRYRELEKKIDLKKGEIERLNREIASLREEINYLKGRISELYKNKNLLENRLRKRDELQKKLKDILKLQKAYEISLDILESIDREVICNFQRVSKEIEREFGDFLPHFNSIDISALNESEIELKDATGEFRKLGNLSKGTRDLFVFAFRLIAAKSVNAFKNGEGFLILDEPFFSLDADRIRTAVKMIKRFHDNYKWQIIFFTKDQFLLDVLKKEFNGRLVIHNLAE